MSVYNVSECIISFNNYEKDKCLPCLKDQKTYSVADLYQTTTYLMQTLMINTIGSKSDKKYEFTEDELTMMFPFALVYASINGNCFHSFEGPVVSDGDCVTQYASQAFCQLATNQLKLKDVIYAIKAAAEAIDKIDQTEFDAKMKAHKEFADNYWKNQPAEEE